VETVGVVDCSRTEVTVLVSVLVVELVLTSVEVMTMVVVVAAVMGPLITLPVRKPPKKRTAAIKTETVLTELGIFKVTR
jgi:hypothetical protein